MQNTRRQGSSDNMACLRGFCHFVFNEITSRNHRKHSTCIEQRIMSNMKFVYNTLLTSTHMNQGMSLCHSGLVIHACGACSICTKTWPQMGIKVHSNCLLLKVWMNYCTNMGGYHNLLAFGVIEVRPALYFVKEKHNNNAWETFDTGIGVSNCEQRVRFLFEVQATTLLLVDALINKPL